MSALNRAPLSVTLLVAAVLMLAAAPLPAQEQSRESMAVDATASQWSFQFAGEGFWDYKDDQLDDGTTRPAGNKGFLQFRLVAPIPKSEKNPLTWLPRLTLRSVKNKEGDVGFGSSDIFVLGIINQWATGRWGFGPQINFPAQEGFGNTNWGLGLAGAVTHLSIDESIPWANLVGALSTMTHGAQPSLPRRDRVEVFRRELQVAR